MKLRPVPLGVACLLFESVGYALEWFRQRGTCDTGDNTPDTLGISILLIVIGGGLLGLVALVIASVRAVRHGISGQLTALMASVLAVCLVAPLFMFAGAGPGSWFQYCGT